jgi:hypothetical protein
MRRALFLPPCRSVVARRLLTPRLYYRLASPSIPVQVRGQSTLGNNNDKTSESAQPSATSAGDPAANKPLFEALALLTPAIIPEDPMGVVRVGDSAAALLDHSALIVERQIEMLNVFLV